MNPRSPSGLTVAVLPIERIHSDPRLRAMTWRDLVRVSRVEAILELLLPLPWLAGSLWVAAHGWYLVALGLSFMFFLTGLRVIHNAFHHALGLSPGATDAVLWLMSFLMLGSMHAVRYNHLTHHNPHPGQEDVEGRHAVMPAWQALALGALFTIRMHLAALREGERSLRIVVLGELTMNVVAVTLFLAFCNTATIRYHIGVMAIGQCLTAFFAVWLVHHHCDREHHIARTVRSRVINWMTFNMLLHIEHHLFPLVPTCHLAELSRRIDGVAPELKNRAVF